jgi:uroporphyrinogen-III synthase
MLHLAGERISFDMKVALAATGHELRTAILYRAVDAEGFSETAHDAIATAQLAGILLMSPATAGVYARLVGSTGLKEPAHGMQYFCLSGAVAERITAIGLRSVNVAATPTEDDLLALVSQRLAS